MNTDGIRLEIDADAITRSRNGDDLDPAVGMAFLFGHFELHIDNRTSHDDGHPLLSPTAALHTENLVRAR
ncbi:MAG TPA: hypothetical protein ENH00_01610 [Actinobacteria bacterium]|nr:hypothetical protein BMS3Bbin01_00795 [bacterium BMS3Bbin01]HDH24876.1 hypothetical protein [Actinomycetota bacterium]